MRSTSHGVSGALERREELGHRAFGDRRDGEVRAVWHSGAVGLMEPGLMLDLEAMPCDLVGEMVRVDLF